MQGRLTADEQRLIALCRKYPLRAKHALQILEQGKGDSKHETDESTEQRKSNRDHIKANR